MVAVSLARSGLFVALLVACVVLLGVPRSGAEAARARPVLLLSVPSRIYAFAADGGQMAWLRRTRLGCAVFFRSISGGPTSNTPVRGVCPFDGTGRWLALGGRRAVWATATSGNNFTTSVETARHGDAQSTVLDRLEDDSGAGDDVRGTAGDGSTLVYAVRSIECTQLPSGVTTCAAVDAVSGVWRVVGHKAVRLRAASVAAVAVSGKRLAIVPAYADRLSQVVEVRSARTGALLTRVDTGRLIQSVALSGKVLVAATATSDYTDPRLQVFDPATGASLGSIQAPYGPSLSATGRMIVMSTRKLIRLVDTRTGRITILASRQHPVAWVTAQGRRVFWVENVNGGRIYTLTIPG
jgi:hypothetical protein